MIVQLVLITVAAVALVQLLLAKQVNVDDAISAAFQVAFSFPAAVLLAFDIAGLAAWAFHLLR